MSNQQAFDQERQSVADFIAQSLREAPYFQESESWKTSTLEQRVNTSGCPLITLTLGDGQAFNITITRKRS
jgi:hypothetical protein